MTAKEWKDKNPNLEGNMRDYANVLQLVILVNLENLNDYRKDVRKITYSKEQDDHSIVLVTELADNELFVQLVADKTVHIIF